MAASELDLHLQGLLSDALGGGGAKRPFPDFAPVGARVGVGCTSFVWRLTFNFHCFSRKLLSVHQPAGAATREVFHAMLLLYGSHRGYLREAEDLQLRMEGYGYPGWVAAEAGPQTEQSVSGCDTTNVF